MWERGKKGRMEARGSELWGQRDSQNIGSEGVGREVRNRTKVGVRQTGEVQETQQEEELGNTCTEHNFVPQT